RAAHDAYQVHPVHLEFVAECAHLWNRVQIYDAVS
ncbi:MAG: stress responsive alpha-beta barrel protein, partial [Spirosoma sp.]|nr:stress responsive alpha-beta barrel protein [Spirosoma sp.]